MRDNTKTNKSHLLGIGLDHEDGHKRITQSEQFTIVGGSESTHEKMAYTVIRTFEELDNKGKSLADCEPNELEDLLDKHKS